MKIRKRKTLAYGLISIGLLLLLSGIILSISIGAKEIDFSMIINAIFTNDADINTNIIRDVRIPRALSAALVGDF